MGIIRQGANGGFKGKAGSVIGSSWKNIHYIKGLPKKRTKPASEEQLIQQARFQTITRFLMPITPLLNLGFSKIQAESMTPTNVALQLNIHRAVVGTYPDFELDYSKIVIAKGSYIGGGKTRISAEDGMLTVGWDTRLSKVYKTQADDQVYVVVYQPAIDEFLTASEMPLRGDGSVEVELPEHFVGGKGHVWIFFTDRTLSKVSKSSYLGELDLI